MPSNGGEFSRWLDRRGHEAACVKMCKNLEMISDKKKRVTKPRMLTYTTYDRREKAASCGWLAPARQLLTLGEVSSLIFYPFYAWKC